MLLAPASEELHLRRQLLDIKQRKLAWMQQHRLYFFSPYCEEQRQFFASKAKVRLLVGPNRIGKTTCGAVEDISFCLGFRPWMLPEDLKTCPISELMEGYNSLPAECKTPFRPPVKWLVVVADWDIADDIWTTGTDDSAGKMKLYIPAGAIDGNPVKNNMGNICGYHFINGSQLMFETQKSFINDPQSFEGPNNDGVHYDEPPDRRMRVAIGRGLVDRGGYEIFTLTPLTEPWIKNEIADRAPASGGKIEVFGFSENRNPYISAEAWDDYVGTLNEDEKAARARGEWIHLKGLIYKEFIPKLAKDGGHIVPPLDPKWLYENCVVDEALDPHPRQPHAVLFMATAKDGRRFIFDEIFSDSFLPELCKLWKAKELTVADNFVKPANVVVIEGRKFVVLPVLNRISDPLAFDPDPEDGRMWADAFADEGIFLDKASKRKEAGISATRQAFKDKTLFICSNCTRTLFEIQNYTWDEWKYSSDRNVKEKPKDKDDHMMENMYRLILLDTRYVDMRVPSKAFKVKDLAEI